MVTDALRAPFALIARINNQVPVRQRFSIVADGVFVCERTVRGAAGQRVDCAVNRWGPQGEHQVVVAGPATGWTLEYLELATQHGHSVGVNHFYVLPADSRQYATPSYPWLIAFCLVLFSAVAASPPSPLPHWTRWCFRLLSGSIVALLIVTQCSQWMSDYRIVLSAPTFVRWMLLALASRLVWAWRAFTWLLRPGQESDDRWTRVARAAAIGALVLVAYQTVVSARLRDAYGGNYSGFLSVSREGFDRNPLLSSRDDIRRSLVLKPSGYDGQFMYFATFDPLLRAYAHAPAMYRRIADAPPYRFGRIGFSLLTSALAGGQWQRYPVTMVWLILGSLFTCGVLIALLAQAEGLTPALGALVILIPGFWQSLQYCLPEPVAAATFLGGVVCTRRTWWLPGGALLAVSLLVRETGIIAVAVFVSATIYAGHRREGALAGVLAVGIFACWRLYVAWILYPDWGVSALLSSPGQLGWPLAGFADLWRAIGTGQYLSGAADFSRAGTLYPILLLAAFVLSGALAIHSPSASTIAAAVYALMGISLNFRSVWLHVANGQRVTYEVFVMLALSAITIRRYSRAMRVALIGVWSLSALYVFYGTFDAASIREALASAL